MFSNIWNSFSASSANNSHNRTFRRDTDDHPEPFTVDPQPLPESVITVKHSNIKHMFNRSYIEAATIGAGSIAVLAMVVKYSRK